MDREPTQRDKLKDAARDLEFDVDKDCFEDRLGKLVNQKPVEKPE